MPRVELDRVAERRRAVVIAHHLRESEALTIAEIALRLGRSPATVKGYFYDPDGAKAKRIKARLRGSCRACGASTAPRGGREDAYEFCWRCRPGAARGKRTREWVREAIRAWHELYGSLPSTYDWSRTHSSRRGGEPLRRLHEREWPAPATVTGLYGTWAAALADATHTAHASV